MSKSGLYFATKGIQFRFIGFREVCHSRELSNPLQGAHHLDFLLFIKLRAERLICIQQSVSSILFHWLELNS